MIEDATFNRTVMPAVGAPPVIEREPTGPRRYMHIRPADKSEALNSQLDEYASRAAAVLGISTNDFGHPGVATAGQMVVVGRIVADVEGGGGGGGGMVDEDNSGSDGRGRGGRLGESGTILLETSRQMGSGFRVPLSVGEAAVSLFPGQLVVLEGTNPDGRCFHVRGQKTLRILADAPSTDAPREPLSMIVAAGPFTLDDPGAARLDMAPFERLLNFAFERRPHILLLLGPFIDADNSLFKTTGAPSTPEELFLCEFIGRIRLLTSRLPHLRVLIVPSVRDLIADPVFPQPPLSPELAAEQASILLLPNPATLAINGTHIALSSSDVLLPLGVEEHCRVHGGDRMQRLCSYLLQQDSFWPLHPAPPGANIDYTVLPLLALGRTPDLLLVSSQLRYFARNVEDTTLAVNPGQFCRKQAPGTAALVTISPRGDRGVDFYQF